MPFTDCEFYDGELAYYQNEEWIAFLEYNPSSNPSYIGSDTIWVMKRDEYISGDFKQHTERRIRYGGSYKKPRLIPSGNNLWLTYESQDIDDSWSVAVCRMDPNGWIDPNTPIEFSYWGINSINHQAVADTNGGIWIVWQQEEIDGQYDIYSVHVDNAGGYGIIENLSYGCLGGDWNPAVEVDPNGNVCVAWDSYQSLGKSYNILGRWYDPINESWGSTYIISDASNFEGRVQLASTGDPEEVWVLWEEGGVNWGGPYRPTRNPKAITDETGPLHRYRKLKLGKFNSTGQVTMLGNEQDWMPAYQDTSRGRSSGIYYENAQLEVDSQNRLWLVYGHNIHDKFNRNNSSWDPFHHEKGWQIYARYIDGDSWSSLFSFHWSFSAKGHWKFDENSGTEALDETGFGNTATLINNPQWVTGKIGGSLQFDGNNHAIIQNPTDILNCSFITMSAWIKTDSSAGKQFIVSRQMTSSQTYGLYLENGKYKACLRLDGNEGSSILVESDADVSVGNWVHMCATYDGINLKLYINGVLDKTVYTEGRIDRDNPLYLIIGMDYQLSSGFQGVIDDIRLYNRPLTSEEIIILVHAVAHWKFDENSGTEAADETGFGNTGTLINDPQWATGRIDAGLHFDGNDYVKVENPNDILNCSYVTMSAWIKPSSANGKQFIISREMTYPETYGLFIEDGIWKGCLRLDGNESNSILVESNANVSVGDWVHLCATYDGASLKLYLNGALDKTVNAGGIIDQDNPYWLTIGALADANSYFNGLIDDVRIYDSALADSIIQQLYAKRASQKLRDGMQRLSVTDVNDGISAIWTTGRTDRGEFDDVTKLYKNTDSEPWRGLVLGNISNISMVASDSNSEANMIVYDPYVFDPNSISLPNSNPEYELEGANYKVVWGDLHRHTDLSLCTSYMDGTIEDCYRYAIDVTDMDFMAVTDHIRDIVQGNYHSQLWWRCNKEIYRYTLRNTFMPLFSYERSPSQDRNVISWRPYNDNSFINYDIGSWTSFWNNNCNKDMLTIPHDPYNNITSPNSVKQPLMEIFQGFRNDSKAPIPQVIINNYLQARNSSQAPFGVIASSDHLATWCSFAGVWMQGDLIGRKEIFDGMMDHRTFGSTDKIPLIFTFNDKYWMGESIYLSSKNPKFRVRLRATGDNFTMNVYINGVISTSYSGKTESDFEELQGIWTGWHQYEFNYPFNIIGENNIYVHIIQTDPVSQTNEVWSSPIWVVVPDPLLGDLDDSGHVDLGDYALLSYDWNKINGQYVGDITGPEGDPDGNVDTFDLSVYCYTYLNSVPVGTVEPFDLSIPFDSYLSDINEPNSL
jgi:hypothetical protein